MDFTHVQVKSEFASAIKHTNTTKIEITMEVFGWITNHNSIVKAQLNNYKYSFSI